MGSTDSRTGMISTIVSCWQSHLQPADEMMRRSEVSIDRFSIECTSSRHKTGNYKGISIFIKFIELDSLTPTRDDLLELKLVSTVYYMQLFIFTPPSIGERSIVISVSVCVFVCPRSYLQSYASDLHQLCCMLPMAEARSSFFGVVIRYVLPVLLMTSYLLISQGCMTSPTTGSAVHTQPWVWL